MGERSPVFSSWEGLSFIVGVCSSDSFHMDMLYLYEMAVVVDGSSGGRVNFNAHSWKKLEIMLILFSNVQSFLFLYIFLIFVVQWFSKGLKLFRLNLNDFSGSK